MNSAQRMRWIDHPSFGVLIVVLAAVLTWSPDVFGAMHARAFLPQWALFFALLGVFALYRKRWSSALGAALALSLMFFARTTDALSDPDTSGAVGLRIAQMNVLKANSRYDEVVSAALATGADVISIQEVGPGLEPVMRAQLAIAYPHMRILARADNYGIALLSKAPFQEARFVELEGVPIVDAVVASTSGPVRIVSVHTTSPGNVSQYSERNAQLIALEQLLGTSTLPTVLVGDLNTVPWDSAFGRLCRATGLHGNHQGIRATWPSFMGLALIPLDHVLVTSELEVLGLTRFTIPGSDHRGLVATLRDR